MPRASTYLNQTGRFKAGIHVECGGRARLSERAVRASPGALGEPRPAALFRQLQMRDPKHRALRVIRQALDLPSVRQHDLLHDGEAEAGAFLVGREVGLED